MCKNLKSLVIMCLFSFVMLGVVLCTTPEDKEEKLDSPILSFSGEEEFSIGDKLVIKTSEGTLDYTINGKSQPSGKQSVTFEYFDLLDLIDSYRKIKITVRSVNDNMESDYITKTYTMKLEKVSTPSVEPKEGNMPLSRLNNVTEISVSCTTPDSTIFYTVNGENPVIPDMKENGSYEVTNGPTYKFPTSGSMTKDKFLEIFNEQNTSSGITLTITAKFVAVRKNMEKSIQVQADYQLQGTLTLLSKNYD